MKFYCQLDYKHIPYISPTSLNGNIADKGCGVCCASMIIEEIKGIDFPPEKCAIFSKQSGAREGFGTDMRILAPAISKEFDIEERKGKVCIEYPYVYADFSVVENDCVGKPYYLFKK